MYCIVRVAVAKAFSVVKETINATSFLGVEASIAKVKEAISLSITQLEKLKTDSLVNAYPYASVTVAEKGNQASDLDDLCKEVYEYYGQACVYQSLHCQTG